MNDLLSIADVCALLGVNKSTIWRWIRAGEFPAPLKLGPQVRRWEAVEDCHRQHSRAVMTNQSSADSFLTKIEEKLLAISNVYQEMEEIDKTKGPLCSDALKHAIECGKLLDTAKESVKAENLKWKRWLADCFGQRLPLSTAELYIKLGENEEHLLGKLSEVSNKRMSLRAAVKLIPLTEEGMQRSIAAKARAEKKKADEEEEERAKAKQAALADLKTEERVGDLAIDEVFKVKKQKGDLEVDEIFMTLTTQLDEDQLLDLNTRLTSYLDKQEEPEKPDVMQQAEAAQRALEERRTTRRI